MLFRTINRNNIVALALMPLLLIGFWVNSLVNDPSPSFPYDQSPMPLWDLIIGALKANYLLSSVISMLIALLLMFSINRIVNRYTLSGSQTNLPGFLYIMLVSGYLMAQKLHPVWFFSPLLMLGIERLFSAYGERKPQAWCLEASFCLSLGSLFYAKGIYFIIFIWMVMFILRQFNGKALMASILGLLLPYLITFGFYFWNNETEQFFQLIFENFVSPVAFFSHSTYSQIYNGLLIFLIFISILSVVRIMSAVKIATRKHFRIFIWLIVLSVLAAITPYYSLEIIPITAIGASIIISRFLTAIRRSFIQELFLYIIFAATISAQFLI